jgi:hypothetical protein
MQTGHSSLWLGGRIAPVIALSALAGCGAQPQPPAVENTAAFDQDVERDAHRRCIVAATNATITHRPALSDEALSNALKRQDLGGCPDDFIAKFTAVGNLLVMVGTAQNELSAHLGREDEARQDAATATASEAWDGIASGEKPLVKWQARRTELQGLVSERQQHFEQVKAELLTIAGKYGLYQDGGPGSPLRGDDIADDMIAPAENSL